MPTRPCASGRSLRAAVCAGLVVFLLTGARAEEPVLQNNDIPGLTVGATATYEGKALYGFIDGGADLYREFGFVRLTVQALVLEGEEVSAEIYRMADDTAAFGIFSVSASGGQSPLGLHTTATSYQWQSAAGPFFVRVVNYTGSDRAKERAGLIAGAILQRAGPASFQIPEILRGLPGDAGRVRFVRGPLGLQNGGLDEWSEPLEGLEPYSGYFVTPAGQTGRVVLIRFQTETAAGEFLRRTSGTAERGVRRLSPEEALIVDGPADLRSTFLSRP